MKKLNIVALTLAVTLSSVTLLGCKKESPNSLPNLAPPEMVKPAVEVAVAPVVVEPVLPVVNSTTEEIKVEQPTKPEKELVVETPKPVDLQAPVPAPVMVAEAQPPISVVISAPKPDPFKDKALPKNAPQHFALLVHVVNSKWPGFHTPSIFAAQTEKESCKHLAHATCWTTKAELKTSREYGFGFGQLTIAYDKMGKVRFNKFEEVKLLDSDLRNWDYADRYDAERQMIALVILNRYNYQALKSIPLDTETDKIALVLAAYNGGLGGVLNEVKLCRNASGCNPKKWFGNIETTTNKSKTRENGYGNSFADINRMYPFEIIYTRRTKYLPYFDDTLIHPKLASVPHRF